MRKIEDIIDDGCRALKAGDMETAGRTFEFLLGRLPHNPYILAMLGSVYVGVGRYAMAIPLLERSLQFDKTQAWAWSNLGVSFRREGHEDRGVDAYKRSLDLDPENSETLSNMSGAFINVGEPYKALEYCEKSLAIDSQNHVAKHHKGIALLELGRFEEGFKWYEGRFEINEWHPRPYKAPLWRGEKVGTLLIHGEQGLGDEVLFLGWLEEAKKRADRVVIECNERLVPVFARSFEVPCVATVEEVQALGIEFDAVCPMGSLPIACGVENRRTDAYLKPDPEKVMVYREQLQKLGPGPHVGLSWKGGTIGTHNYIRCAPPDLWIGLPKIATCLSIQYGPEKDLAPMIGVEHWDVDNIDNLCALIAALDLVVTVNNTCVHLSGALGVPCWTMTPSKPAWRYQLSGESIPWYRSVRQFRQVGDDWPSVFKQVEGELADYARVSRDSKEAA